MADEDEQVGTTETTPKCQQACKVSWSYSSVTLNVVSLRVAVQMCLTAAMFTV